MFAQNCSTLFESYEIQIQKADFNQAKKINAPAQFVGLQQSSQVLLFSAIGIGILLLSLSLWFEFSEKTDKQAVAMEQDRIIQLDEVNQELPNQKAVSLVDLLNNKKDLVKSDSSRDVEVKKTIKKQNSVVVSSSVKEFKKDSIITAKSPKVIVIKRQVVKRDTLYVSE
jgi:predicted nuclease of predicted toxin-antitoxin system